MDTVGRHAPLNPEDTETQTLGCQYSNSDVCGRNGMPGICAFAREDGVCLAPPSHEGNYSMPLILNGARVQERAAASH